MPPFQNNLRSTTLILSSDHDILGPNHASSFSLDLILPTDIDPIEVLKSRFGFQSFRDGQLKVIDDLLAGNSAAAVFPTGGGKSICYQLPAVIFEGITLVVSPLIALMKDQIDALKDQGIAAERLDSTLTNEEYQQVSSSLRDGTLKLLYVAPERFNNERFRELIRQINISLFAVDEAHCISEWGHNFRPDYLKLARYARECGAERILALTATAPPKVLTDICNEFKIDSQHATRTPFYRSNLRLLATPTTLETRNQTLIERLVERPKGSTVIYVTLQKTAVEVAQHLQTQGLAARHYHAGMKPDERSDTQDWFIGSDDGIIVATIAFGMGIDKSNIRYVYHYNFAKSVENYAQEIGRAGRDGLPSVCETLLVPDDVRTLENFVYGDTPTLSALRSFIEEVFSQGEDFGLNLYQLSSKNDIRDLVTRTLLTYFELDGYLQGGTPYYAEYKFHPLVSSSKMLELFDEDRQEFLSTIFLQTTKAAKWFTLDIEQCVKATNSTRARVVNALEYLQARDLLELKVSGVRHRYKRLKTPEFHQLAESLNQRIQERQTRELARIDSLVKLLTMDACQVSALSEYFGETLDKPCGHCSWCETKQAIPMGQNQASMISEDRWSMLRSVQETNLDLLGDPQTLARFAAGVSSPFLARAKLTKHELFGAFSDIAFNSILEKANTESAASNS
jgi:ATP-dependent DNA helicase RecQ